jgi:hypothetical protein
MQVAEQWIEWHCPVTGVDFDEFRIVSPDTVIRCCDCGGHHRIGDIGTLLYTELGREGVCEASEEDWRAIFPPSSGLKDLP